MILNSILLLLFGGVAFHWWRTLPAKLAEHHQRFRDQGEAALRDDAGRMMGRVTAQACEWSGHATFVLLPIPLLRSQATVNVEGVRRSIVATTIWPSMSTSIQMSR